MLLHCCSSYVVVKQQQQQQPGFDGLQQHRLDPFTYSRLLRECRSASEGKLLHASIERDGLVQDGYLGANLVHMYLKCRNLPAAVQVFQRMHERNVVLWTAMISAYVSRGSCSDAIGLFRQMQAEGVQLDAIAFITVLNACTDPEQLAEGKVIHACIDESGLELNDVVGTALVNMYGKCGSLEDADELFNRLQHQDVVLWNAMISANAQDRCTEAIVLFGRMQQQGVMPDVITFISILKACASTGSLAEGKTIHSSLLERGFESDVVVGTALINMYAKGGDLDGAWSVFCKMKERNVVSWGSMIAAFAQKGHYKALELFHKMLLEGIAPSKATFFAALDACTTPEALPCARLIEACIVESGLGSSDVSLGTALVMMYGKCRTLEDARRAFNRIEEWDMALLTAMISVYAQHGNRSATFQLFRQMILRGMTPDRISYITILNACASLAALPEGKLIHACVVQNRLDSDVVLGNAIVSMYGECGSLENAKRVFDKMPQRDLVSWNAMISAYAQHGYVNESCLVFQRMQQGGFKAEGVAFVNILSACAHVGLVEVGCQLFASMGVDHDVPPANEHYGCMVSLLGRKGRLTEAEEIIQQMPIRADASIWRALLSACRSYGDIERGKLAAERVLELDPDHGGAYVALSNIYSAASRWEGAASVRQLMVDRGLKKQPGWSSIEMKNKIHEFVAQDRSHPQTEEIYGELEKLTQRIEEAGYEAPTTTTEKMWHGVEEEEQVPGFHSEKLAIAFGLISTRAGTSLHIIKNLQVCVDCHNASKFISKVVEREIVVRDATRFHHFRDGVCSCGDYW